MEGMQMNWVRYLINELQKDFCEAHDQGYGFHFNWLLMLIAFIAWKMMKEPLSWRLNHQIRWLEVLNLMVYE
jgi:hypothetical protein